MLKITTPAIVLRRQGFLEADRKIVLMTKSHGKVTAYVKGVRWAKGKLVSLIEPFSETEVHLQIREGIGLATLIGGVLKKSHPVLRTRLPAWTTACTLCELTDSLSPELTPHSGIHKLLGDALTALEKPGNPNLVRLSYTLQFLREIGYGQSEQIKTWGLTPDERRLCETLDRAPMNPWAEFPNNLAGETARLEKHLKQVLDDHLPQPLLSAEFYNALILSEPPVRA
jgi:hypothetical protein